MPRIFISYRRNDSAFVAQQVHEKLTERFGEKSTFIDLESIPPGADFVERLREAIGQCDVLLAVIGDRWLDARYADGPKKGQRRLDDPDDLVRIEIASALKLDIPVIPVLVGNMSMASVVANLPSDLENLKTRNATPVRAGRDLACDLQALARGIKEVLRLPPLIASDLVLPPGIVVLPKGLRSFDESDTNFFLRLLPGPYGECGLPESICFWKSRIEQTNPAKCFRVGAIYGPSGCGKSSLVKAALLPRLAGHVTPVYVEATADDTEKRLLVALRKDCPYLAAESSLRAALGRKAEIPAGRKVLIVLDQFEQWLHSTPDDEQEGLAEAMRECDGARLQCLLMVRDDFLTPITRFMNRLQIVLCGDRNCTLVDLFDKLHAKKVLALLGQAFGGLPKSGNLSREQDTFLNRAVSGLAEGDHVICVRLALFAQMVKAKRWAPATLKAVGGAHGVGVAFLEDSFTATTAPAESRRHQAAAQKVLAALLPKAGTSIRGATRSRQELLVKSGYRRRPANFDELLGILDNKLRLVTPISREARDCEEERRTALEGQCYQLTHDYLVPSLREWLARKQKETRRGRAELRLAQRSESWNNKPENRYLPAWWEMLDILAFSTKANWTDPERKMMRKAGRYHAIRDLNLAAVFVFMTLTGLTIRSHVIELGNASHAASLVQRLLDADIAQVPRVVGEMKHYRAWTDPLLKEELCQAPGHSSRNLHASLGLLPVDPSQAEYLYGCLLTAEPKEVPVIRDALAPFKETLTEKLWSIIERPPRDKENQRLPAACALATYDPNNPKWGEVAGSLTNQLVAENPLVLGLWIEEFRPVEGHLLGALAKILRDTNRPESERSVATSILADYAGDQAAMLADLTMDADEKQFTVLFPRLKKLGERAVGPLRAEIDKRLAPVWNGLPLDPAWENAAAALVRQIESAQGILAERFAFCQTMPLDQFRQVAEGLRKSGYRPTRFRPYPSGTALCVAAVWTRDGRDWQMAEGVSAEELFKRDADYRKLSLLPIDVSGSLVDNKEQYAALWVKAPAAAPATVLQVGLNEKQLLESAGTLRKGGYITTVCSLLVAQDGTTKISTIRAKLPGEAIPVYNSFIGLEPDYSGENYLGDLQIDVQVSKAAAVRSGGQRSERRYAAVWHSSPWLASTEVHGLGPSEHLARCRALMAEEYRPASLSVADTGNSQTVAASVWIRPIVPEDDKEKLARRQTNAAVALLGMNRPEQVWPLLKHSPDPRVRSYLTHRLGLLDANAEAIVKRLDEEVDVTIRRALVLSLGEFDEQAFAPGARDSLRNRLREWYRTSDDPGLHAAAEWVLRQWKENQWLRQNEEQSSKDNKQREERQEGIRRELAKVEALPQWYVNGQGQTMVVIPGPVEYLMGSPRSEAGREDWETLHRQRIGRSFSLAAKLVSVEQFLRFRTDFDLPRQYAPASDCPVLGISWYQAAEYCNWLSKQEGLAEKEWCYEPNTNGRFEAGMKPAPDFLKRSGYRLPTEAEWEYVCRACALTSRHYGETEELLAKYGWYSKNSGNRSWPVGNLKPNDLGMFDMHGNAWEWCHDTHANYTPAQGGKAAEDIVDTGPLLDTTVRALRDGGFYALARHMRCANRNWNHPGNRNYANGFRIARTGQ